MSDQDGTFKTHKPVMISHHRPFVLRKRSELWKEWFIGNIPTKTHPVARRKKIVSKREAAVSNQNEDFKTSKIVLEMRPPP